MNTAFAQGSSDSSRACRIKGQDNIVATLPLRHSRKFSVGDNAFDRPDAAVAVPDTGVSVQTVYRSAAKAMANNASASVMESSPQKISQPVSGPVPSSSLQRPVSTRQARRATDIFGLRLCPLDPMSLAVSISNCRRTPEQGVGIVATANIQHVAAIRKDVDFRNAMYNAEVVTCDGFPVYRYARLRGYQIDRRTTGREIVAVIMQQLPLADDHRLYFVVDSEATVVALERWVAEMGLAGRVEIEVPPPGFIENDGFCRQMAGRIAAQKSTLLFLCVGAPQSEVFADLYRGLLPPCWALCVGQSVKLVLGLSPEPPKLAVALNVEWLWRIFLEPQRMLKRYVPSATGFMLSMAKDVQLRRTRRKPKQANNRQYDNWNRS